MTTPRLRGGAHSLGGRPRRRRQAWALLVFLSLRRGPLEWYPDFGREGESCQCWCLWRGASSPGVQGGERPCTGVCHCWLEDVPLPGHPQVPKPRSLSSTPAFPSLSSNPYYWSLMMCVGKAKLSVVLGPVSEAWVRKSAFGAEAMNDLTPLASPPRITFLKQKCSWATFFSRKPKQFLQHLGWERALTLSGPGTDSLNSHAHNSLKSLTRKRKIFMVDHMCVCEDNSQKAVGFLSYIR